MLQKLLSGVGGVWRGLGRIGRQADNLRVYTTSKCGNELLAKHLGFTNYLWKSTSASPYKWYSSKEAPQIFWITTADSSNDSEFTKSTSTSSIPDCQSPFLIIHSTQPCVLLAVAEEYGGTISLLICIHCGIIQYDSCPKTGTDTTYRSMATPQYS